MLSVVIPAFNEQEMVPAAAGQIDGILSRAGIPHELIFIDDGSRDATWAEIRAESEHRDTVRGVQQQRRRNAEALVRLHAVGVERDDRDVFKARLFERAADKGDVIARAAAAAGLRHGDGETICVVFSGQNGAHDLADDRDGGEAGVVIDVFQARVDGAAVVVAENFDVIAVFAVSYTHLTLPTKLEV